MVHMAPNGKDLKGLNGFKLVNKKGPNWATWVQMGPNGFKWIHRIKMGPWILLYTSCLIFGNFWAILGRALMMMCEDILLHVAGRDWLSKA